MVKGTRLELLKFTAFRIAADAIIRPDLEVRLEIGRRWVIAANEALPR